MEGRELETFVFKAKACLFWKPPDKTPPTAGGGVLLCGSSHHGFEDEGKKEKEEEEEGEGRDRATTNEKREEGKVEARGHRRARVGIVLTLISLRMTSIMLPITMRKSNTFQGSLKYPYTG